MPPVSSPPAADSPAPSPPSGEGPLYLTGGSVVSVAFPPPADSSYAGSAWGGQKVIWALDGHYGPLLLRGRRLDGPQALRFDHYLGAVGYAGGAGDGIAYPELTCPAHEPSGLTTYPSAVRLQAPGCYGVQVDGIGFTSKIIFRVVRTAR